MSRWLVLPILFFLASSFALLYISSHPIVFRLCLFSFLIPLCFLLLLFLCSPWFLKFSLDALADSLPQLFSNCFQFFFFFFLWKEHWQEGQIPALRLPLLLTRDVGKAVSFWTPPCGWTVWVTRLPRSASAPDAMWDPHVGQKCRLREEIRIFWWCWCWCLLPASVSVPDKQCELVLFSHYSEKDSY